MRRQKIVSEELRRLRESKEPRCQERHPMWHGVRCERADRGDHLIHHAEGQRFEWIAERTAF